MTRHIWSATTYPSNEDNIQLCVGESFHTTHCEIKAATSNDSRHRKSGKYSVCLQNKVVYYDHRRNSGMQVHPTWHTGGAAGYPGGTLGQVVGIKPPYVGGGCSIVAWDGHKLQRTL